MIYLRPAMQFSSSSSSSSSSLLMAAAVVVAFALVQVPCLVSAHGSMLMPAPRNAIDSTLPAWSDGKHPMTGLIEPYSCSCTNGSGEFFC